MGSLFSIAHFSLSITGPIFVLILFGLVLMRIGMINDGFIEAGSRLVFNVALPVLLFLSISKTRFEEFANIDVVLFGFVATLITYILLELIAKYTINERADRGVFVQGSFRSNLAIIGLAYCFNAYGEKGLAVASIYIAMVTTLYNVLSVITLNLSLNKQQGIKPALLGIIKNPLIISILLALVASWYKVELPQLVILTGQYFANLTLPLALLCTGATLNFSVLRLSLKTTILATFFKILLIPIAFVVGGLLLEFRGFDIGVLLFMSSAPTAASSYVMVRAMGGNDTLAANIVGLTTLLSMITTSIGIMVLTAFELM
jgi:malonate transporter